MILLLAVPFVIGKMYGVSISGSGFLSGILKVGVIYIPVAIVEFLVYAPMLGTGGSYLSFLTGNVTNLKIPCAMNARDIAKTTQGTVEDEIVSTLSVATSALVTMLILFVGVLLLVPLTPIIQNPVLAPAAISQTSLLLLPAGGMALGIGFFLHKKDLL